MCAKFIAPRDIIKQCNQIRNGGNRPRENLNHQSPTIPAASNQTHAASERIDAVWKKLVRPPHNEAEKLIVKLFIEQISPIKKIAAY